MDEQQLNKAIGYAIAIIVGYYLVGVFIPMLTWGVIGLVVIRIYQANQKYKK
jgi:cytochrome b